MTTTMNTTMNTTTIENKLAALEAKHLRHQRLHEGHRERKEIARERHRRGWHTRKHAPNTLI